MSRSDPTPVHLQLNDEDTQVGLVEELPHTRSQANLARGIVWADIVAAIAADEEARQARRRLGVTNHATYDVPDSGWANAA